MYEGAINGTTKVLGVIGDPISHTISPPIHNRLARVTDTNIVYVPFHVTADNVKAAVNGAFALGVSGLNVTVPHKRAVIPYLTGVSKEAASVGACNTLVRTDTGFVGHNTDLFGIEQSFRARNVAITGKQCAVIGAGGGACAAVYALLKGGAADILIFNRTIDNAVALANRIGGTPLPLEDAANYAPRIVIQTTTVGLSDANRSPVTSPRFFSRLEAALDMIYAPKETAFLRRCAANAPVRMNGFDMLVFQAFRAFELFTGANIEHRYMEIKRILEEGGIIQCLN